MTRDLKSLDRAKPIWESLAAVWRHKTTVIAVIAVAAIVVSLLLRFAFHTSPGVFQIPLLTALALGGVPLVYELLRKLFRREFGSDLLAGISIVTSVLLGEYLAGSIVVLVLSGGEALESYALRSASSVLRALAKRMPSVAHRKRDSTISDVALDDIAVADTLVVYPHDICPVDGTVIEGNGVTNEACLTGEPFQIHKAPGAAVISRAGHAKAAQTLAPPRPAGLGVRLSGAMAVLDGPSADALPSGLCTRVSSPAGPPTLATSPR